MAILLRGLLSIFVITMESIKRIVSNCRVWPAIFFNLEEKGERL